MTLYISMQSEEMMLNQTPKPKYLGNWVKYFELHLLCVCLCVCACVCIFATDNYYISTQN